MLGWLDYKIRVVLENVKCVRFGIRNKLVIKLKIKLNCVFEDKVILSGEKKKSKVKILECVRSLRKDYFWRILRVLEFVGFWGLVNFT